MHIFILLFFLLDVGNIHNSSSQPLSVPFLMVTCSFSPQKRHAAATAKSCQSCPTRCDPIDGSWTGSSVPGILQARTLEWVAISFSNAWKGKVKVKLLSRVRLLATSWTLAYQAPPSMGFSRQEYWSGLSLPSPKEGIYSHKSLIWLGIIICSVQ